MSETEGYHDIEDEDYERLDFEDYHDAEEEFSGCHKEFSDACNSNNHQEVIGHFQLFFIILNQLIDLCPEQPTEEYEILVFGNLNGLHAEMQEYLFSNLSQREVNIKATINFFSNIIASTLYWNKKKLQELSEEKTPKIKLKCVKNIINSLESIQYFLAHFSTEKRLLEICATKDKIPNNKSTTQDDRFKSRITNHEIAYCINHLFGTLINQLTKGEKVMLFAMITGRSGVDVFNNWGGDKLTPSQKIEIEAKLKSIKAKIKSK